MREVSELDKAERCSLQSFEGEMQQSSRSDLQHKRRVSPLYSLKFCPHLNLLALFPHSVNFYMRASPDSRPDNVVDGLYTRSMGALQIDVIRALAAKRVDNSTSHRAHALYIWLSRKVRRHFCI